MDSPFRLPPEANLALDHRLHRRHLPAVRTDSVTNSSNTIAILRILWTVPKANSALRRHVASPWPFHRHLLSELREGKRRKWSFPIYMFTIVHNARLLSFDTSNCTYIVHKDWPCTTSRPIYFNEITLFFFFARVYMRPSITAVFFSFSFFFLCLLTFRL